MIKFKNRETVASFLFTAQYERSYFERINVMKKIISVILAAVIAVSSLCMISVQAEEAKGEEYYKYHLFGSEILSDYTKTTNDQGAWTFNGNGNPYLNLANAVSYSGWSTGYFKDTVVGDFICSFNPQRLINGGVRFRGSYDADKKYSGYMLAYNGDGAVYIGKYVNGGLSVISAAACSPAATDTWTLRCSGTSIQFLVGDTVKINTTDATYSSGDIGLYLLDLNALNNFGVWQNSAGSKGASIIATSEIASKIVPFGTSDFALAGNVLWVRGQRVFGGALLNKSECSDFEMSVQINTVQNGGVLFRRSEGTGGKNGYIAASNGEGKLYIGKYVNGALSVLAAADYVHTTWDKWTVRAVGDKISVYINDASAPILSVSDSTYASGKIEFYLYFAATVCNLSVSGIAKKGTMILSTEIAQKNLSATNMESWSAEGRKIIYSGSGSSWMEITGVNASDFIMTFDLNSWTSGEFQLRRNADENGVDAIAFGADGTNIYAGKFTDTAWAALNGAANAVAGGSPWAKGFASPAGSKITVLCVGSRLAVYVGSDFSAPYIEINDSTYTSGNIGVHLNGAAEIENLEVYALNDIAVLDSASLTLGCDLTMNYYIKVNTTGDYTMTFERKGTVSDHIEGTAADGLLKFAYEGINPQCMTDNITAKLWLAVGEEKIEVLSKDYSVREYITALYGSSDSASLKTLLADLVAYGAAAQVYSGYNDDMIDEAIDWTPSVFDASDIADSKSSTTAVSDDNKVKSAALILGNVNYIRFNASVSDAMIAVNADGEDYTDKCSIVYGENGVTVTTGALTAKDNGTVFEVILYNDGGILHKVTYSANSYILAKCGSSDTALANLVQRLSCYGISAEAYK